MEPDRQRTFLQVDESASGNRWIDRLDPRAVAMAGQMSQRHGTTEIISRVLAGRGIAADAVEDFLDPSLKTLMPDPATLTDMPKATQRLANAIAAQERVGIFGDYDVDGACSTALLARYLQDTGCQVDWHIPDRISEGYGPNVDALNKLADSGCTLIVTVDCGSSSFEAFEQFAARQLDLIVVDHHQMGEGLPKCLAVVNPNRPDDLSDLGHLCAAGVVFMLLVSVNRALREQSAGKTRRPAIDLLQQLDLVALATIADVVPLHGLNRAFVRRGLIVMHRRQNIGLKTLGDIARLDGPPTPYHLGFVLGPRINAGGRIGDAGLGVRLLLADDETEAQTIAVQLDRLNVERRSTEATMLAEAEAEIVAEIGSGEGPPIIIVAKQGWHPGIVGILASRLKDRFRRPALAIAVDRKGSGTGSARSVPGFDIGKAVRRAVEENIASKGGGHQMAAGITIESSRLAELRALFETQLAENKVVDRREISIDGALSSGAITAELIDEIEQIGPFGTGNPEPIFALPAHKLVFAEPVGGAHIRFRVSSGAGVPLNGIAFRAAGQPLGAFLQQSVGHNIHLAGSISKNFWQGVARPQLRLVDAAPAKGR